jgi:hypothetical protein
LAIAVRIEGALEPAAVPIDTMALPAAGSREARNENLESGYHVTPIEVGCMRVPCGN